MKSPTACFALTLLCIVSLVWTATCVSAEPSGDQPVSIGQLPELCRAAKANFRPLTEDDLQAVKADLVEAMAVLEQRLSAAGEKQTGWKRYLRLDSVKEQFARKPGPDIAVLDATFKRFSAGHEGLGLTRFVNVRQALRRYLTVARAIDNPNLKAGYEKLVGDLAGRLETYLAKPTSEDALVIGDVLSWLEAARQTPELVEAVRLHLVHPNILLQASAEVISAGIGGPVDNTTPIREVILGTDIYGTGHTVGQTSVELVPNAERGVFDVLLVGTAKSENVGHNGPVRIYSTGTTEINARKQFMIDAAGLTCLPATCSTSTQTNINNVRSKRGSRVVERAAWKRIRAQKGQAERIASQRAERRVNSEFDGQGDEMICRVNQAYVESFRNPLSQRNLFPRQLSFSTTKEALHVVALQAGPAQLAAPGQPPQLVEGPDLAVRIHESLINNLAAGALSGMMLREEAVAKILEKMLGELPEQMKPDEDREPWAITFARRQPISVGFDDGRLKITIRGRKYYKAEEAHPGMDVSVTYKITKSEQGLNLIRQGDLQIFPPGFVSGKDRLTPRQIVIQTLLQRRFDKIFKEEVIGEGLVLPGKWGKAGKMRPVQLVCKDGWLTIAWKRVSDESVALRQ